METQLNSNLPSLHHHLMCLSASSLLAHVCVRVCVCVGVDACKRKGGGGNTNKHTHTSAHTPSYMRVAGRNCQIGVVIEPILPAPMPTSTTTTPKTQCLDRGKKKRERERLSERFWSENFSLTIPAAVHCSVCECVCGTNKK